MTEIATLGEFGLIDRLTAGLKAQNPSTCYGVGDDCAVLRYFCMECRLWGMDLRRSPVISWRRFCTS